MDSGNIYIKMCEKAVEIQKQHNIQAWDYYYSEGRKSYNEEPFLIRVVSGYCTDNGFYGLGMDEDEQTNFNLIAWLPRQDQLQEMMYPLRGKELETKFHRYWNHPSCKVGCIDYWGEASNNINQDSMEQLWLAFCLKKLYNKIWNNETEEWVINE